MSCISPNDRLGVYLGLLASAPYERRADVELYNVTAAAALLGASGVLYSVDASRRQQVQRLLGLFYEEDARLAAPKGTNKRIREYLYPRTIKLN